MMVPAYRFLFNLFFSFIVPLQQPVSFFSQLNRCFYQSFRATAILVPYYPVGFRSFLFLVVYGSIWLHFALIWYHFCRDLCSCCRAAVEIGLANACEQQNSSGVVSSTSRSIVFGCAKWLITDKSSRLHDICRAEMVSIDLQLRCSCLGCGIGETAVLFHSKTSNLAQILSSLTF